MLYGGVLLAAAVALYILQSIIVAQRGTSGALAGAIGTDYKGMLSPVFYLAGICAAFFLPWLAGMIYVGVAAMWLVPDRRIEKVETQ